MRHDPRTVRPMAAGITALLVGCSLALSAAGAPEGGSLKGAELKPTVSGGSLTLGSILGDIFRQNTAKGPGKILGVKVAEDTPEFLTLLVRYTDVSAEGMTLTATALEKGRRPRTVAEATVKLPARQGEAEIRLDLPADAPEEVERRQALLNLSIGGTGKTEASEVYECAKSWKRGAVDVTIQAVPIGKPLPDKPTGVFAAAQGVVPLRDRVAQPFDPRLTARVLAQPTMGGGPTPEAKKDGAKGPGQKVAYLRDLSVDPRASLNEDDLGLPIIIEDANKGSGYYYYLPSRYYLDWSEDRGHDFSMVYSALGAEGNGGSVQLSAMLAADLNPADLAWVREQLGRRSPLGIRQLLPFPYSQSPEVALVSGLGLYNIKKEQISVTGITPAANYARISFVTDPVTKESIQLALTGKEGLNGTVNFTYGGEGGGSPQTHPVPVRLHLADEHSFRSDRWERDQPLRNRTPYPIKLKYLRFLTRGQYDGVPTVYTYDLKNTVLRSGGSAKILGVPTPYNNSPETIRIWVEYLVEKDEAATAKVLQGITAGVTSIARSELGIRTLTFMQDLNVAAVVIKVSSRYFDTNGAGETVKTLDISKEGMVHKIAPIYLVKRQAGEGKPGAPLFKYKLQVILQDGTVKESKDWVEWNDLNLPIGKVQVKRVLEQP